MFGVAFLFLYIIAKTTLGTSVTILMFGNSFLWLFSALLWFERLNFYRIIVQQRARIDELEQQLAKAERGA